MNNGGRGSSKPARLPQKVLGIEAIRTKRIDIRDGAKSRECVTCVSTEEADPPMGVQAHDLATAQQPGSGHVEQAVPAH